MKAGEFRLLATIVGPTASTPEAARLLEESLADVREALTGLKSG